MQKEDDALEYLTSPVSVSTPRGPVSAVLTRWDEAPEDFREVKLRLEFKETVLEARSQGGYWQALCELRQQLEAAGMLLVCNGTSLNVYPSAMSADMGTGEKAYRMTLGRPALMADLVVIFDTDPDVVPSTVDSQRAFHSQWLASLE